MNPLLLAAVMDTVVAPYFGEVHVHEWGVVRYRSDVVEALGTSGGPWSDPMDLVVEAPVIHIWGSETAGSLTVRSRGRIYAVYPDPDEQFSVDLSVAGGGSAVSWRGIRTTCPWDYDEIPYSGSLDGGIDGLYWDTGRWRDTGALVLTRESDGFCDRFLYYEVDLSGTGFPGPLGEGSGGESSSDPVMLFTRNDGWDVRMRIVEAAAVTGGAEEEALPPDRDYDRSLALEALSAWAGYDLKQAEIEAMWDTWEPWVLWGDWAGGSLVVFPVPDHLEDRISTIEFVPDDDLEVYYGRFFLGMAEVR